MRTQANLSPGDMVYYQKNSAIGILISRDRQSIWSYNLTSASTSDSAITMNSIYSVAEKELVESIDSGRLKYYPVLRKKKNK